MASDPIQWAAFNLAEAFGNGSLLPPLPAHLIPPDLEAAEAIADKVMELLDFRACGLRLAPGPDGTLLCGPVLEGRLVENDAQLSLVSLPHIQASRAWVAVLAEALQPEGTSQPVLAAVHPALDLAASRFIDGATDVLSATADLSGLGMVVLGRAQAMATLPADFLQQGIAGAAYPPGQTLAEGFMMAATEARRLGGLPAGAILVLAGLSPDKSVAPGERLNLDFGTSFGSVTARFA